MVKKFKIGPAYIDWVFRHIWEKDRKHTNYLVWKMRKKQELGVWFEKNLAVGPVKKGKDIKETQKNTFSNDNFVNIYTLGFNLIVCSTWFRINFKPTLGIKK